jgi:hypothetical protein
MYTLYVKEKLHYVCAFCVMSYCFVCFCMYKYGLCRKGTVNTLRASNYYFLVLIILPVRATRIHDPAVTFPEKINILSLTQTKHNKLANTRVVHIYVYTGTLLRGESSV